MAGALLVIGVITHWALENTSRRPYLIVGWLWYLGSLVPMIGIIQVGSHRMADRYTYLPLIGIFIAGIWFLSEHARKRATLRIWVTTFGACAVLGFAAMTYRQTLFWRNDITLFEHALAVTPPNAVAHANLGYRLQVDGHLEKAAEHFEAALRDRPDIPELYNASGAAYGALGRFGDAAARFETALAMSPENIEILFNAAQAYDAVGETQQSLSAAQRAYAIDPDLPGLTALMARSYAYLGEGTKAAEFFERAVAKAPEDVDLLIDAGNAYAAAENYARAIELYQRALEMAPDSALALYNLANAEERAGDIASARQQIQRVLELAPDLEPARALADRLKDRAH